MASSDLTLQGEALRGLEFVIAEPNETLYVNGQKAPAIVADSVLDMCGVIVSLKLTPSGDMSPATLEQWLASVRDTTMD